MAAKAKPRVKETRAEKARRFQRMGSDLVLRDNRLRIEKLLGTKTSLVPSVVDFLISIGAWDPEMKQEDMATPPSKVAKKAADSEESPGSSSEKRSEGAAPSMPTLMNKNYTSIAKIPSKHLTNWLSLLEPTELSTQKLKALIVRGQAKQTWTQLAQILEFLTDLDPSTIVLPQSKTVEDIVAFEESLKEKNHARLHRVSLLTLPPQWSTVGVYAIQTSDEGSEGPTFITHRYRGVCISVPDAFLFEDDEDLFITDAHSEKRAELSSRSFASEDAIVLLGVFTQSHPTIDWGSPWTAKLEFAAQSATVPPGQVIAKPGFAKWCPPPPAST